MAEEAWLEELWDRLLRMRALAFEARSASRTGWNGRGNGDVVVKSVGEGAVTFEESGLWRQEGGREHHFSNVYRWSRRGDLLRLEHLRFGENRPVFLFDLAPTGPADWRSVSPHVCSEDCYAATLRVGDGCLVLAWAIDGPHKREDIEYVYSW
jgi:Family of unknown function (DUF6314)